MLAQLSSSPAPKDAATADAGGSVRADGRANTRVCLGVITGARGLKGELRVKSFTGKPMDVAAYGPLTDKDGGRTFDLRPVSMVRGLVIARLHGIQTVEAAQALKGTRLYVDRGALPKAEEGEFYHADLIGLEAGDTQGRALGTVTAVHDYGAGTMLEIGGGGHGEMMIPFNRQAVPTVDLEGGRVVIDPPHEIETETEEEAGGNET
jgi:16S rRNA processing protein RimM